MQAVSNLPINAWLLAFFGFPAGIYDLSYKRKLHCSPWGSNDFLGVDNLILSKTEFFFTRDVCMHDNFVLFATFFFSFFRLYWNVGEERQETYC